MVLMRCRMKRGADPVTHLIQLGLVTREREGEAKGQLLVLDFQLLHEVGQALGNVVEELKG